MFIIIYLYNVYQTKTVTASNLKRIKKIKKKKDLKTQQSDGLWIRSRSNQQEGSSEGGPALRMLTRLLSWGKAADGRGGTGSRGRPRWATAGGSSQAAPLLASLFQMTLRVSRTQNHDLKKSSACLDWGTLRGTSFYSPALYSS